MSERPRRPLAAIYADDGTEGAWLVAETPHEAQHAVVNALLSDQPFVELTLGNPPENDGPEWNGRPVFIDPRAIRAIGPPLNTDDA